MVTISEAKKLDENGIKKLKDEIREKAKASDLNAYVGEIYDSNPSGIPILIKDNINVKGKEVVCSSKILKGYISPYNATVVDKLEKAGFSCFGTSNMDEFAMGSSTETSCHGKTKNPHDKTRVPGGSSGGSAAAVGGKIAVAALGTDTGGSIRQPASHCGCVGLKPTYGTVSRYGIFAFGSSLDQVGPITQNVRDNAILYDAISGKDEMDSTSIEPVKDVYKNLDSSKRYKIVIVKETRDFMEDEVEKVYDKSIEVLKDLGHEIVEKSFPLLKYALKIYYILAPVEGASNYARYDGVRYGHRSEEANSLDEMYVNTRKEGFGFEVRRRIIVGSLMSSAAMYEDYYIRSKKIRYKIIKEYKKLLEDADILFMPVAPKEPFVLGSIQDLKSMQEEDIFSVLSNMVYSPAISVPAGTSKNNMPIGMQFMGKDLGEQEIFNAALGFEEKVGTFKGAING